MRELLVATRNEGKMPELISGLEGVPFNILSLNDTNLPADFAVEEPGSTYEAHAAIKAFTYGKRSGLLTLADDSGLEVDAFEGWPGVHSATHVAGSDLDRINALLDRMKDVPDGSRGAQFRTTVAIYNPADDKIRFAEGVTRGSILRAPRGAGGHGYDPVFLADELQQTFAEASLEAKMTVSQRARALAKAREVLLAEFV